jgi:type VI secretion system protein ImpE
VLEVMAQGQYYWVPMEQIETVVMNAPKFPRDLLWVPARLELREGSAGNVYLPVLYPNTHEHADPQVKLGRAVDWKQADGGPVLGAGPHTYLLDDGDCSLLEWRQLEVGEEEKPGEPGATPEQPTS